jgi:2-polyprenyl-6-methoxyphenol hydroxylase-like FAD-dependent oxidoreductase
MTSPRILVSGAGIAGLALSHWLRRVGLDATLVDRAPDFHALGHYISLKGNGVEVVRQMGLERTLRARELTLERLENLTAEGHLLRSGSPSGLDHALGGYLMLRRSDLAAALYDSVKSHADLRYGTEIASIESGGDRLEVAFTSGATERFDFVFGADGIHSRTRRIVFGDGFEVPLGGYYIGLTEHRAHGLPVARARVYYGRGQTAMLVPTSPDTLSAVFYHHADGPQLDGRDASSVARFLREAYAGFAPDVTSVIDAIDESAFVFSDVIAQVRMPSIVQGRVALLGDAAHCPTFMSGMGASLALQGARALALELAREPTPRALLSYEQQITPIATRYRDSALRMRTFLLDRRPWLPLVRNAVLRATPDWLMDRQVRSFFHAEKLAASAV